jgi:DNA-directed RNA polymerase specialized sigma24 family protein
MAAKTKINLVDYVNMIRKFSWYYAKKFGMDYEDVEAQGFLIFCISAQMYKKKKAQFSTFLYRNLKGRLHDYCEQKMKKQCKEYRLADMPLYFGAETNLCSGVDFDLSFDIFPAQESAPTIEQFLSYAKCYVSMDAYNILYQLLNGVLLAFRSKTNPSLTSMAKVMKMDIERVKSAWQELFDFWNMRGAAFYADDCL